MGASKKEVIQESEKVQFWNEGKTLLQKVSRAVQSFYTFLLFTAKWIGGSMIQPPTNLILKKYSVMRERNKKQRIQQQKKNKVQKNIYCLNRAAILSSQINEQEIFTFDSDDTTTVTDNSANAHILNAKRIFVGDLVPINSDIGVATIGSTDHKPTTIGTAWVSWKDDAGITHHYGLNKALYFPNSPVNIISVTSLEVQLNDDERTYFTTKRKCSTFYWNEEKGKLTIHHSLHCLSEIAINNGFEGFKSYYLRFRKFVNDHIFHVHSSNMIQPPTCNRSKEADFNK
eukprot:3285895-Ditylum_brightwellii.AAC.1